MHISYYYNDGALKYATNASGSWKVTIVGITGAYTSLALDTSGKVHICYCGESSPNDTLRYITNASGAWVTTIVDAVKIGYVSLSLDTSGNAHISFYNKDLKYAYATDTTTEVCKAESITMSRTLLTLRRNRSDEVTVEVTSKDGCLVEGETVTATVNKVDKSLVSILSAIQITDEDGQATFTITGGYSAGNETVTFQAGSLKKMLTVKVR